MRHRIISQKQRRPLFGNSEQLPSLTFQLGTLRSDLFALSAMSSFGTYQYLSPNVKLGVKIFAHSFTQYSMFTNGYQHPIQLHAA